MSDHEMYAALQADIADEQSRARAAAEVEVARLRQVVFDLVMEAGGYTRQENGRWQQELSALVVGAGMSPERAVGWLHRAGLTDMRVVHVPTGGAT